MIETKQISSADRTIVEQYKAFGWEETGETPAKSKKEKPMVNLARDTEMAHYKEIKVLEGTYDAHLGRMLKEPEIDYFWAVLLFLCAIIPGLIYVKAVKSKKAKAEKYNEEQREYLKNMCIQAKKVRGL